MPTAGRGTGPRDHAGPTHQPRRLSFPSGRRFARIVAFSLRRRKSESRKSESRKSESRKSEVGSRAARESHTRPRCPWLFGPNESTNQRIDELTPRPIPTLASHGPVGVGRPRSGRALRFRRVSIGRSGTDSPRRRGCCWTSLRGGSVAWRPNPRRSAAGTPARGRGSADPAAPDGEAIQPTGLIVELDLHLPWMRMM